MGFPDVSSGDWVCVRDLSFCMVAAAVFLAETLVLQGVDIGVMYLPFWFELMKSVGSVWGSP
jgi:hypothetical protein